MFIADHLADAARKGGGLGLTPAVRDQIVKDGVVHGFNVAIGVASAIMLLAALVAGLLVNGRAPKHGRPPAADGAESADAAV